MLVLYINLDTQPDRRARLDAQLARLGLAATRLRATTPADIAPELLRRYCPGPAPWWLTPPELACTLSHIEALRQIAEGEAPFGLVLEDDAHLSAALPAFLAAFADAAPGIDLVKLDGLGERMLVARDLPVEIGGVALRRVAGFRIGTTAYLVSKAAAARLVSAPDLLAAPIDATLFHPWLYATREMAVRHADPALCTPDAGARSDSTIAPSRGEAQRLRKAKRTWHDTLLRTLHQRGLQLHNGMSRLGGARRLRGALAADIADITARG